MLKGDPISFTPWPLRIKISNNATYFQERNLLCVPTVRKHLERGKDWRTTKTSSIPKVDNFYEILFSDYFQFQKLGWNTVPPVERSSPPTEVWRATWTWSTEWRSGFNVNTAGSISYQPRATGPMKNWLRARPTLVISVAGCTSRQWDTITLTAISSFLSQQTWSLIINPGVPQVMVSSFLEKRFSEAFERSCHQKQESIPLQDVLEGLYQGE